MKFLRKILGILVMIAGILGLVLSLAGLVGVWMIKPTLESAANSTLVTLKSTIDTSQKAMKIAEEAFGATVESVDALSNMLGATATTVKDTMPLTDQFTTFMGGNLPDTLQAATESLKTAQQAAQVLDSSIKSLENFRAVLGAVPLLSSFVEVPMESYNPEKPLADSLGDVATNLESLPGLFTSMSEDLDKASSNLETIQKDLTTMSEGVALISKSLSEYKSMISQSQASMKNLTAILDNIQKNLATILNGITIALSLFLLWLLVSQIVILSQGWELYQGTAGRMEGGEAKPQTSDTANEAIA